MLANEGSSLFGAKRLIPKLLHLTFAFEDEGHRYVTKLDAVLERGVAPDEFRQQRLAHFSDDLGVCALQAEYPAGGVTLTPVASP